MKDIKLQSVLREIKKHTWWSEEAPGVYNFVGWPLRAFIEQAKYAHPKYLSISIFIFRNGFFYEETPADEKLEIYNYIYKKISKDKLYLKKLRKSSEKIADNFFKAEKKLEKGISQSNNDQLWKLYEKFYPVYLDYLRYAAIPECVDIFSSENLPALIKEESPNLNIKEALDVAFTMSAPLKLSFLKRKNRCFFKEQLLAIRFYRQIRKLQLIKFFHKRRN